jgi:hypothetical protein
MVIVCAITFITKNSTSYPHSAVVFIWFSEQANILPYTSLTEMINLLNAELNPSCKSQLTEFLCLSI